MLHINAAIKRYRQFYTTIVTSAAQSNLDFVFPYTEYSSGVDMKLIRIVLCRTEQMANNLRDTWSTTLKNGIRHSLKDVGKGWFNLHETNRETYDFSKLKRFLTLTRFIMEDTLRFLLEDNITKFHSFLASSAGCKVACAACMEEYCA